MIRNSAHDSICACSADEVGRAVLHRYDTAATLAAEVTEPGPGPGRGRPPARRARWSSTPGPVAASGVVESRPGRHRAGARHPGAGPVHRRRRGTHAASAPTWRASSVSWPPTAGCPTAAASTPSCAGDGGRRARHRSRPRPAGRPRAPPVMAEAWAQAGAHRHQPLQVGSSAGRRSGCWPGCPGSPATGGPPGARRRSDRPGPGRARLAGQRSVRVEVDPDRRHLLPQRPGRLRPPRRRGRRGRHLQLLPPRPATPRRPARRRARGAVAAGPGPRRAADHAPLHAGRRRVDDGRRVGEETVTVVTDLELRAGEPLVRVTTSFDNRCRGPPAAAWFPLPRPAHSPSPSAPSPPSAAGRRRGRPARAGPGDLPVPALRQRRRAHRHPRGSRRIRTGRRRDGPGADPAAGHRHAVPPGARPRPNAAGPADRRRGPAALGPHRGPLRPGRRRRRPVAAWPTWPGCPLRGGVQAGPGRLAAARQPADGRGAEVSALRRVDGAIELRVFNPSDDAATVEVPGSRAGWSTCAASRRRALAGRFPLRPWGIATARLDASPRSELRPGARPPRSGPPRPAPSRGRRSVRPPQAAHAAAAVGSTRIPERARPPGGGQVVLGGGRPRARRWPRTAARTWPARGGVAMAMPAAAVGPPGRSPARGAQRSDCTATMGGTRRTCPASTSWRKPNHKPWTRVPLPAGTTTVPGAWRPSCSQISKARVLTPCTKAGWYTWLAYHTPRVPRRGLGGVGRRGTGPAHFGHLGAERLHGPHLAGGGPLRHEDLRGQAGPGRVGGHRHAGVAAAVGHHPLHADSGGQAHHHRRAPVLKGTGRHDVVELGPHPRPDRDERGVPLAEGDPFPG